MNLNKLEDKLARSRHAVFEAKWVLVLLCLLLIGVVVLLGKTV